MGGIKENKRSPSSRRCTKSSEASPSRSPVSRRTEDSGKHSSRRSRQDRAISRRKDRSRSRSRNRSQHRSLSQSRGQGDLNRRATGNRTRESSSKGYRDKPRNRSPGWPSDSAAFSRRSSDDTKDERRSRYSYDTDAIHDCFPWSRSDTRRTQGGSGRYDRWQHDGGGSDGGYDYDPFDTEGVISGGRADTERRLAGDQWFAAQHAHHGTSRHCTHPAPTIFIKAL